MTRKEYEEMSFDTFMEWANENIQDVTDEDILKDFAIEKIQDNSYYMALHIINALNDNTSDTEWYRYDYSMGRLETPTPITDKEDIEDLIFFDDEE